ncbi:MAG: MerR family transcriptional regulator [Desulfobacterales bacterium]|nr:MerR family transcriptional regulator [Desulfobacterales bacterium]MCP4159705.1 MerR family transcriptional regulator [Deltaproteobacteria bacterium]
MGTEKEIFTISELAAQLDISPSSIRFYEDKGLIKPKRTKGNQRIYTLKNRARLKLILRGKRFGASLDDIAEIIGAENSEFTEVKQIENSLKYIELKFKEIEKHQEEIILFKQDLESLKEKLDERLKNLE